ncbi:MAG: DUF3014 domain-containing protein [Acidobacteriota bacterium]|nr:DUF3014 domain-containing protein [Acidobacteriota bacterium]
MRIDEVSLDRGHAGPPAHEPGGPPGRRGGTRAIAVVAIAGLLGALVYFVWIARGPAPAAQPAPTTSTEVPLGATTPLALPDEPLPPLTASDTYIRRVVALLSSSPAVARWLASDALIQRTATAVEQAGDGRSPVEPFAFSRPGTRAATVDRAGSLVIDPASFRRWDDLASTIVSIDPRQAAELYRHVRPLFVETYRGMGHPDGNFDAAIGRAAGRVLETPVLQEPLVVEPRRGYVEHRSEALRALPGISRQLLLMGPANVQRLKNWTTAFLKAAAIEPR